MSGTAIQYSVDTDRRLILVRLEGAVTFVDVCETVDSVLSAAGGASHDRRFDLLVDIRVVTDIPSEGECRKLAIDRIVNRPAGGLGRVAIVAMTRLGLELAESIEQFADEADCVRIFTDEAGAKHWLRVN